MTRVFGLIGFPLSHSFSKGFFADKFTQANILDARYDNFPIETLQNFAALWENNSSLEGINITIPHKKAVIPFVDHPSSVVKKIQACNCIRKFNNELYGYNTDVIGFEKSLLPFLKPHHKTALILGTGGAAAAVEWVLEKLQIEYRFVTRQVKEGISTEKNISYASLTKDIIAAHTLIVNTSPVGMYPNIDQAPDIPYEGITSQHHLYDLIYNPAETLFLTQGKAKGATIQNGLEMLHLQAEASWEIWNSPSPMIQ
jgi:shikimate dehydrogenase